MTTLEPHILVTEYEQESGRVLPPSSFYKSIALDIQRKYKKGIDYDLEGCLEYNPQSFIVDDIKKVLAVIEGENDGSDWHWVLLLNDNRYIYLRGGCDYTGWDC